MSNLTEVTSKSCHTHIYNWNVVQIIKICHSNCCVSRPAERLLTGTSGPFLDYYHIIHCTTWYLSYLNTVFPEDSPAQSPEDMAITLDEPESKKQKKETIDDYTMLLKGDMEDGQKYMEKFNQEMMDQFLEYQRRYSSSYVQWERERYTCSEFSWGSIT